jgi:cytochrome c peroxidase
MRPVPIAVAFVLTGAVAWSQVAPMPLTPPHVPTLPVSAFNYRPLLPPFFSDVAIARLDNTPSFNPITDGGATLGRVLFYDTTLSRNGTVACASCHAPAHGFTDGRIRSQGFEGALTRRHSMGLTNARYYDDGRFFWDERAASLEAQVLMPIQDAGEMGMTLADLVSRLQATSYYPSLFRGAFGDETITPDRVSLALAQFVRSLVSFRSRYDEGRALVANAGERFPNFTDQESQGKQLFLSGRTECSDCHSTEVFAAPEPRNNGLDAAPADTGVGGVTGTARDSGSFKAPSLRNVALRAPYMHDGRFAALEDVVEFYNSGIQASPNLDRRLRGRNGQPRRLDLSPAEKAALVAFLNTLTDELMVNDPKFADPFVP